MTASDGVDLPPAGHEASLSRLIVYAREPLRSVRFPRRQLLNVLRLVKMRLKVAGVVPVPHQVLHLWRRMVKPLARGRECY